MIDEKLEAMFDSLVTQSDARLDESRIPGQGEHRSAKLPPTRVGWVRFVLPVTVVAAVVGGLLVSASLIDTDVPIETTDDSSALTTSEPEATEVPAASGSEPAPLPTAAVVANQNFEVTLAGKGSVVVPSVLLRTWIGADSKPDSVDWTLDADEVTIGLNELFDLSSTNGAKIVDGEIVAVPGATTKCCDEATVENLREHLITKTIDPTFDRPFQLELSPSTPESAAAELAELGIVEPVASFTTTHPCCANRVKNIQRFADLMNGAIIKPNSTLSLNDYVGERTEEKGFVPDGVIVNGELTTQVGGGVSQYATTLFNAAFFAGLEFDEYESHSVYISRYPQGREANLSWPSTDLVIRNQTDFGVLVWADYTETEITVTLYSTSHIETELGAVLTRWNDQCRDVTAYRERTYPDGRVESDSVSASYFPGLKRDCSGNEVQE